MRENLPKFADFARGIAKNAFAADDGVFACGRFD